VYAIAPQVDNVLIIDNASDPPVDNGTPGNRRWGHNTYVIHIPDQPPNLSALWNIGLRWACDVVYRDDVEDPTWDVAVLCDDAIVPDGWFRIVADGMRAHNAAAASTHGITPIASPIVKTAPDSDIRNRMCSWAFVTAGERNIQADERLHFWWGDTRFDFQAREAGGMVILPGPVVVNERPNDFLYSVPGLGEQAGRDTEMFTAIYNGWRPW
jgi:hypothetical protein